MKLAIIGAGPAGTAAAWALRHHDVRCTLFEKSRGYSGRAATRRRGDVSYDHGANYFKTPTDALRRLVLHELPNDELEDIAADVGVFDEDGRISPGDPEQNRASKWTYRRGINVLGKHLARASGADVRLRTRVHRIERQDERWEVVTTDGDVLQAFDAVLITPPAPQAADVLDESPLDVSLKERLVDALRSADYSTQLSVVLGYEQPVPRAHPYYALLNTDRQHAVAWIGFEEDKPGHVPPGQSVIVAQMAPAWWTACYDEPDEHVVQLAAEQVATVLDELPESPDWYDVQRWRYALPQSAAATDQLAEGADAGLFFAGDGLVGKGRVSAALESGLDAARQIRSVYNLRDAST